jgi:hypothetical protein
MTSAAFTVGSPEEYRQVFKEAEELRQEGRLAHAAAAFAALLRFRLDWYEREPRLPFTINEFIIVERLADLAQLTGQKAAARALLTALLNLSRAVGNVGLRIHVATKVFFVELSDGKLERAVDTIRSLADVTGSLEEIEITPPGLPRWEGRIRLDPQRSAQDEADQLVCLYDTLGALLLATGRYTEGVLLISRGLQIAEANRSPVVDSRLLAMKQLLVRAYLQKGELGLAESVLDQLEPEPEAARVASGLPFHILELRSKIALLRGQLGEACRLLGQLAELSGDHHLPLAEIQASINLAQIQILLNQTDEAGQILDDCRVRAHHLGENELVQRIELYRQIADQRVRTSLSALDHPSSNRRYATAPAAAPAAPAATPRTGDYLAFFEGRALVFQWHLAQNQPAAAAALLAELRPLVERCDSMLIHVRFHVLEFMLGYFRNVGLPDDFPVREILAFLSGSRLLPELWQFRRLLGHTDWITAAEKPAWISENQALLDRITASLPPTQQALFLLNKWSPNEEFLAALSDDLLQWKHRAQSASGVLERWRTGWKLIRRLHHFGEEVSRYKDHLARAVARGERPADFAFSTGLSGALSQLWREPASLLTVSLLVLPDRVVITSKSFLKVRLYTTAISRVVLRQLVFALRDWLYPAGRFRDSADSVPVTTDVANPNVPPPGSRSWRSVAFRQSTSAASDPAALLHHLAEILQIRTIVDEHGPKIRHIRFLADDVLHGFPFTLLASEPRAGVADRAISIAVDGRRSARRTLRLRGQSAFVTGIAKAVSDLAPLPGVETEVKAITQMLEAAGARVRTLLDEAGTIEAVTAGLAQCNLAHFAGHGKFDFRKPDRSGLVLAGGELLMLRQILSLPDLSRLQLIVLSSCRGAEHFVLPGRWIIGLPETFCRAGAQAVLAFLWPVEDAFAAAFTSRFYAYLADHSPATAFHRCVADARNRQLAGLDGEYWLPQYWAGAVLYER